MKNYVIKVLYVVATFSIMASFPVHSQIDRAATNSGEVHVNEIKADHYLKEADSIYAREYFYIFNGSLGNDCGKPRVSWSVSRDQNINTLLHMAYFLNATIKVGIEPKNCIITTVHFMS